MKATWILCWAALVLGYVALAMWMMVCPLMWILRDGLGPDGVETTGLSAIWKFMPMLLIGAAIIVYLALLHFGEQWLRRHCETDD